MVVVTGYSGTTRLAFVLLKRVDKTGIALDHRYDPRLRSTARAFDVRRGRGGPLRKRCPRETGTAPGAIVGLPTWTRSCDVQPLDFSAMRPDTVEWSRLGSCRVREWPPKLGPESDFPRARPCAADRVTGR